LKVNLVLNPDGGNVGINTTNVQSLGANYTTLEIKGKSGGYGGGIILNPSDAATAPAIWYYDGNCNFGSLNSTPISFITNGSERFRCDSSGRLLVGTSSSASDSILQIRGTAGDTTAQGAISLRRGYTPISDLDTGSAIGKIDFEVSNGGVGARIAVEGDAAMNTNDYPSRLTFSTTADGASSPTERMRITATGLVSIKSDSGFTNGIKYDNGAASSTHHYDRVYFGAASYYIMNNSAVGVRLDDGATSWSAQSDERLKTNLTEISDGLGKIGTLRAVTGRYLNDETTVSRSFLIAQDVRDVLPEAVSEDNDDSGTLNLRYTEVIPLLVAALKESKERIEQLETEMAAVKAQLA
jgi:hypothetical protein